MDPRFVLLLCAALPVLASPAALAKPELRAEGHLSFELQTEQRFTRAELDKQAVLELRTRREKGFRGGFEARLTSASGIAELREIYLEHESESGTRFLVGQHRKSFGLDWENSLEERIALDRGLLNQKLTKLSYVGRDTLVRLRGGRPEAEHWSHELSLHTANGLNAAVLYQAKRALSASSTVSSTTLAQLNQVETRTQPSAAQNLAFSSRGAGAWIDAELFIGQDHLEETLHDLLHRPRTVLFSAAQATLGLSRGRFEPFFRVTAILNDMSAPASRAWETTAGAKLRFAERLYAGAQLQLRRLEYPAAAAKLGAEGLCALRYFF
ncbi:MAG: hypothetical protein NDJ90_07820 [Oligoflexia bacterium]|nr:hypothetical protein [Oligoflexia bacterium]